MLYTRSNVCALYSLDDRNRHLRNEIWIFTEIFEVSSTERCSLYIYARGKDHIFASASGLLAKHRSGFSRKLSAPCRGYGTIAWAVCYVIVIVARPSPTVIVELKSYSHWAVGHPDWRYSQSVHTAGSEQPGAVDHVYLLLQCQFADKQVDLIFYFSL